MLTRTIFRLTGGLAPGTHERLGLAVRRPVELEIVPLAVLEGGGAKRPEQIGLGLSEAELRRSSLALIHRSAWKGILRSSAIAAVLVPWGGLLRWELRGIGVAVWRSVPCPGRSPTDAHR